MPRQSKKRARRTGLRAAGHLSKGVIVVLSGGAVDPMNPREVRERMNQLIADVNSDPYVLEHTNGKGLTFKLLPGQKNRYVHQTAWRRVCAKLKALQPSPLIVIGHSNGGAAAMSLARCLGEAKLTVDLLVSCDSVFTLDDLGDPNEVPQGVTLNLNSYVIPTEEFWICPFPIGRRNRRETGNALDRVVNIGLAYRLGGCIAHRNAFYELAGGDETEGGYARPHLLLTTTIAVLRRESPKTILEATRLSLQELATKSKIRIELETKGHDETIVPLGLRKASRSTARRR
jgi:pimeloyl-ACP methyl ester carboxylesterase